MSIRVRFRDLTGSWEAGISSPGELTCREAARLALDQTGKALSRDLKGVIFMTGGRRVDPDAPIRDGEDLSVVVLVGGG